MQCGIVGKSWQFVVHVASQHTTRAPWILHLLLLVDGRANHEGSMQLSGDGNQRALSCHACAAVLAAKDAMPLSVLLAFQHAEFKPRC